MTITGDVFLFFLGILALVLMSMSNRHILIAIASSLIWFSLFIWLFFSDSPILDFSEGWAQIIAWSFLALTFVPWLLRITVEIRSEAKGKKWSSWGRKPTEEKIARSVQVKSAHRERLRAAREHRRV